ncbi:hypothetical protein L195_g061172, partial [Trifolium pratense]
TELPGQSHPRNNRALGQIAHAVGEPDVNIKGKRRLAKATNGAHVERQSVLDALFVKRVGQLQGGLPFAGFVRVLWRPPVHGIGQQDVLQGKGIFAFVVARNDGTEKGRHGVFQARDVATLAACVVQAKLGQIGRQIV